MDESTPFSDSKPESSRCCHVWMAPADQRLFQRCAGRGCGHVFGLWRGELSPPALMLSADPLPPSRERLTAQTKPRASGSIRFPAHHLSVTLDSSAAVLLASLDCEL